ncbi:MAG: cation:proton antiporter [Gemmatimonadaceae bacterium]|nr:cation:proton antiporter [Gemmatimonadaceae bacterium]
MPNVALLLAQIVVVLVMARVVGRLMRKVGQPQVVGEMVAGIMLGPSVFGAIAPVTWGALFPNESLGFVNTLSQLGLILFMFLVGLELDTRSLRARGRSALIISWASIAAPFAMGVSLAYLLYDSLAPAGVRFSAFALFLGAAMSVTAFPVLARILEERGLTRTPLGVMAITCAAVGDVTAWLILAVVVSLARSGEAGPFWITLGGTALYVTLMLTIGGRLLARFGERVSRTGTIAQGELARVIVVVFVSAGITEVLGIHALFGAFLAGAVMPRDEKFRRALASRFEDLLIAFLLPLFFAFTGLRTQLSLVVSDASQLMALAAIMFVAVSGKFGGTAVAARFTGMSWRSGVVLGALMNTRGLMELVILNIGLDIGVISPTLFAMMVVMAIVTTLMTTPFVIRFSRGLPDAQPLPAESAVPVAT